MAVVAAVHAILVAAVFVEAVVVGGDRERSGGQGEKENSAKHEG